MKAVLAAVALAATACSQHVYSPPAQAFALNPIGAMRSGQSALGIELSRNAQIFDPAIESGAARVRTGVGDHTELSMEGTVMAVEAGGTSTADRRIYSGHAGIRGNPGGGSWSFTGGVGGGYAPSGGVFAAADMGIGVGFQNCVVVPVAQASVFASEPLVARAVDVTVDEDKPVTSTPERTIGLALRGGVRISLDHAACRRDEPVPWLTLGFAATSVADKTSDAGFGGVGIGIEFPM